MANDQVEIAQKMMRRARARADELLERLAPQISRETQSQLSEGVDGILRVFEENMAVLCCAPDDMIISTSEAAELLFVSRPHVVKLIEEGKLPLHHVTGQNRFLRKADVLAYKAKKRAEARRFFESQAEDGEPSGL